MKFEEMAPVEITEKTLAIVMFGPATPTSGMKAGEYYQVTIDPNAVSPSGDFIYFGMHKGDQINGWQRVEAITIAEILGPSTAEFEVVTGYASSPDAKVTIRAISGR